MISFFNIFRFFRFFFVQKHFFLSYAVASAALPLNPSRLQEAFSD